MLEGVGAAVAILTGWRGGLPHARHGLDHTRLSLLK